MSEKKEIGATTLFFDLGFVDNTADLKVSVGGRKTPLEPYQAGSEGEGPDGKAAGGEFSATHVARDVVFVKDRVILLRVYGAKDSNGIPALVLSAVFHPESSNSYSLYDTALSVVFVCNRMTNLNADKIPDILAHIASVPLFNELAGGVRSLGIHWNSVVLTSDKNGETVEIKGKPAFQYKLQKDVDSYRARVVAKASPKVDNDTKLKGASWETQDGVSSVDADSSARWPDTDTPLGGYHYNLKDTGPNSGVAAKIVGLSDDLELTIELTNNYIRHMSIYAVFERSDGTAIELPIAAWLSSLESGLADGLRDLRKWLLKNRSNTTNVIFEQVEAALGGAADSTSPIQRVGSLSAETTILGIPVSAADRQYKFKIPSDEEVGGIRILAGSLGLPSGNEYDPDVAWIGMAETVALDLLIPAVSLVMGVGMETSSFAKAARSPGLVLGTLFDVLGTGWDIFKSPENVGGDVKTAVEDLISRVSSGLLSTTETAARLAAVFASEEIEDAIPILGWALQAETIEGTIEQLIQTVAETAYSPRVVEFNLAVTMDVIITMKAAKVTTGPFRTEGPAEFAATATTYLVTAQYSDNTCLSSSGEIKDPKEPSFEVTWRNTPVGGAVVFTVSIFSEDNQLVGYGYSESVENKLNGAKTLNVTVPVVQKLYQIGPETRYQHKWILDYDKGAHAWKETGTAPSATARSLKSGDNTVAQLESLNGISLNNYLGILGYSWQGTDLGVDPVGGSSADGEPLYVFQNVSTGRPPDDARMFSPKGFIQPPMLAYPHLVAPMKGVKIEGNDEGLYFYVDENSVEESGFHLRRLHPVFEHSIPQDSPKRDFDLSRNESWGRFDKEPISVAIHSNGYVVAITENFDYLQILKLPPNSSANDKAPWAHFASGPGTRAGLIDNPKLVAIAPNQTIFVLEEGNWRIQAFSKGGHPVQAFPGTETPYWLSLDQADPSDKSSTITWVSMSIDQKGYLYLFSFEENGYEADQYRLDVYTPDGKHLFRQTGLAAAGLAVDLWRNLFTLNYETLNGPGGRMEPSVSEWIPNERG